MSKPLASLDSEDPTGLKEPSSVLDVAPIPLIKGDPHPSLTVGAVYSVPVSGEETVPGFSVPSSTTIAKNPPKIPTVTDPQIARPLHIRATTRGDSVARFNDWEVSMSNFSVNDSPGITPIATPAKASVQDRKGCVPASGSVSTESSLSGLEAPSLSMAGTAPSGLSVSISAKQSVRPLSTKPALKKKQSSAFLPSIAAAEAPPAGEVSDRISLGICAMDKKARSKPMAEILSRFDESLFYVVFFGDDMILNKPVHEWPKVQVLIAFYSKGYPLQKAKEYVDLHKPLVLNDLEMQELLKDRRRVYDLLEASGIDVPRHVFVSKDGYVSTGSGDGNRNGDTQVKECDDHIEINGVSIHKPFVEKPVDADDHDIAIYYPTSAGGGCKKLFRKIGNRSSEFYPDINEVRRDGSYIYEAFVETQGTDVKMYTIGPEYGHAEARKSPTVDGKVQRNADGKEIRFPVILTLGEKEIARRIVLQFKQFVCGFDLLRVQEGHSIVSYVCDVNGFSFVKNSRYVGCCIAFHVFNTLIMPWIQHSDDCLLLQKILRRLCSDIDGAYLGSGQTE